MQSKDPDEENVRYSLNRDVTVTSRPGFRNSFARCRMNERRNPPEHHHEKVELRADS
jgi:hypothetical protein